MQCSPAASVKTVVTTSQSSAELQLMQSFQYDVLCYSRMHLIFSKQQGNLKRERCAAAARPGLHHMPGGVMTSSSLLGSMFAPATNQNLLCTCSIHAHVKAPSCKDWSILEHRTSTFIFRTCKCLEYTLYECQLERWDPSLVNLSCIDSAAAITPPMMEARIVQSAAMMLLNSCECSTSSLTLL